MSAQVLGGNWPSPGQFPPNAHIIPYLGVPHDEVAHF
jgi:hypothetical protein